MHVIWRVKKKQTFCFLYLEWQGSYSVAHGTLVLISWLNPLVCQAYVPVSCSTSPVSFSSVSEYWARCVFSSMMKNTSSSCRIPMSSRLEAVRADSDSSPLLWGCTQLSSLSPCHIHLPFSTAYLWMLSSSIRQEDKSFTESA